MKWLMCVAAVLCSIPVWAQDGVRVASETTTSASPSTRANPTAASFTLTSGAVQGTAIELKSIEGLRVSICVTGGVLSGAGSVQAYLLNDRTGLIERNPSLDLPISVTAISCQGTTCPCEVFPDIRASGSRVGGWVLFAPNGVTHTGTAVTVRVYASVGPGR